MNIIAAATEAHTILMNFVFQIDSLVSLSSSSSSNEGINRRLVALVASGLLKSEKRRLERPLDKRRALGEGVSSGWAVSVATDDESSDKSAGISSITTIFVDDILLNGFLKLMVVGGSSTIGFLIGVVIL